MHTVSGKDTFETDRITSVLTVLYHGFHTSILVSLFLNETETVVKNLWILIGLRAKSKPRASSEMRMSSVVTWVFPRIAPYASSYRRRESGPREPKTIQR